MTEPKPPTIAEAMTEFLAYLKATRSPGTAKTYATGTNHFRRYLSENGTPPDTTPVSELQLSHATGFVTWLYEYLLETTAGGQPQKVHQATKASYFASLSAFFDWLVIERRLLPWNLTDYDALCKTVRRASKRTNRDELPLDKLPSTAIVEALLAEAGKPLELPEDIAPGEKRRQGLAWMRNIAILETFVSSGMRVGELVRLERGHLLYELKGAVIKYGKGGKERETLLSDRAWAAIQTYLSARADAARNPARLPVFARHDRSSGSRVLPLTTRSVETVLFTLSSRAGILEKFHMTPHSLRHFFATEFLSETGSLALTQYALGHSNPGTTRIYAQTKREDYRKAYRKAFG